MSKITHWAELLPEVGPIIARDVLRICMLKANAKHAYSSELQKAETFERELENKLEEAYSASEIRIAKQEFYAKHSDTSLQPVFSDLTDAGRETYVLPDGRKIAISDNDAAFLRALRKLPVETRIAVLHIDTEEAIKAFTAKIVEQEEYLLSLLGKPWRYRETGDKVVQDQYFIEAITGQYGLSKRSLMSQIRSHKLSYATVKSIIQKLTGDRSDYYIKH